MSATVVGLLGSPHGGGSTAAALDAVLRGCAELDAACEVIELAGEPHHQDLNAALHQADAVVFASPTYRSTYTSLLASALEALERGRAGEPSAISGKAAAVVMTGAAPEHLMGTERLHQVLSTFFAVQVLAPPIFLDRGAFDAEHRLDDAAAARCRLHGRALVELSAACRASEHLRRITPLV